MVALDGRLQKRAESTAGRPRSRRTIRHVNCAPPGYLSVWLFPVGKAFRFASRPASHSAPGPTQCPLIVEFSPLTEAAMAINDSPCRDTIDSRYSVRGQVVKHRAERKSARRRRRSTTQPLHCLLDATSPPIGVRWNEGLGITLRLPARQDLSFEESGGLRHRRPGCKELATEAPGLRRSSAVCLWTRANNQARSVGCLPNPQAALPHCR